MMDLRSTILESPTSTILAASSAIAAISMGWLIYDFEAWKAFGMQIDG